MYWIYPCLRYGKWEQFTLGGLCRHCRIFCRCHRCRHHLFHKGWQQFYHLISGSCYSLWFIPRICHHYYAKTFWGQEILEKFWVKKPPLQQNRVNFCCWCIWYQGWRNLAFEMSYLIRDSVSGIWYLMYAVRWWWAMTTMTKTKTKKFTVLNCLDNLFIIIIVFVIPHNNPHISHPSEQKRLSRRILSGLKEHALDSSNYSNHDYNDENYGDENNDRVSKLFFCSSDPLTKSKRTAVLLLLLTVNSFLNIFR